jgi:phosphoribosylformimino-5-aminoimidazole carboxamide ribotide isomerase
MGVVTMADFAVIPALDLQDGVVVQAKAGDRADYRPITSPFGAADDPVAIARGLLAITFSPALYIADLDAIAGSGNHFELVRGISDALPGVTLWIDAGFSDVADCAFWLPLGATLVIGSESLARVDDWLSIREAFGESVVLSLDFGTDGRRGPEPLFSDPALWPNRLIAMDLTRVGADTGPDVGRLKSIVAAADGRAVFAAGGVRNLDDLAVLASLDAQGALMATALHSGAVSQKEIAALVRERRS